MELLQYVIWNSTKIKPCYNGNLITYWYKMRWKAYKLCITYNTSSYFIIDVTAGMGRTEDGDKMLKNPDEWWKGVDTKSASAPVDGINGHRRREAQCALRHSSAWALNRLEPKKSLRSNFFLHRTTLYSIVHLAKCIQRKIRCTFVKFHRQTAPIGPGHNPSRPIIPSSVPPLNPLSSSQQSGTPGATQHL